MAEDFTIGVLCLAGRSYKHRLGREQREGAVAQGLGNRGYRCGVGGRAPALAGWWPPASPAWARPSRLQGLMRPPLHRV